MEFVVVGILLLLVVHAANKTASVELTVAATNATPALPPPSPVSYGSAASAPSPATAMGAPGAAHSYHVLLDTNSPYANPNPNFYVSGVPSALQGVPLPFIAPRAQNGFNAVPARTKMLSTQKASASSQSLTTPPVSPTLKL